MQPQGLEALMQSQPMPQMNNPRLAAAMDVVTSDAEEQILDPRTLAMLKYKDALQAMQAADQMMASAQPAPTAPTVAERTRLAAEQGIAGLAQRLSPGVQQRGGQMAAQQAQQMMSGGLPQLSAPNMAGMAGGGIVGFAGEDGSVVEKPPKATSLRREQELVDAGVPPDEARRISREEMYQGMGELAVPTLLTALDTPRRVITEVVPGAIADAYRGAAGVFRRNVEDPARAMFEGATRGGGEPTTAEEIAALYPASAATPERAPLAEQPNMFGVGIDSRRDPNFRVKGVDQQPTAARAAASTAAPAATPTNTAESQLRARVEGTGGSTDAGSRYRELTGMEDAIKERRVEQDRLRALQEARFSPEQERSRLLRAGLAGLASRGFGGFSSGIAGEEEAIAGERDTAQQQVIADMDKTISELRALGIGQFEAEQAAAEIHSNELRALAALDQDAARLKQDMTIEEMRQTLARESLSAEERAAEAKAVNDYALRMGMTPKDVYTLALDILSNATPGTMTYSQAVQEVIDADASFGSSLIQGVRLAE